MVYAGIKTGAETTGPDVLTTVAIFRLAEAMSSGYDARHEYQ